MTRRQSWAGLGSMVLVFMLWAVAPVPLTAQQASGPTSPAGAGTTVASSSAPTSGPRLRPEWRQVTPKLAERGAPGSTAPYDGGGQFVTYSTVLLVLVVVLIVLLVV